MRCLKKLTGMLKEGNLEPGVFEKFFFFEWAGSPCLRLNFWICEVVMQWRLCSGQTIARSSSLSISISTATLEAHHDFACPLKQCETEFQTPTCCWFPSPFCFTLSDLVGSMSSWLSVWSLLCFNFWMDKKCRNWFAQRQGSGNICTPAGDDSNRVHQTKIF